jgi:DNA-binding GntR family transcriptional regulator
MMVASAALAQADFRVAPLTRDTLQERVYKQLAELILDGGIAPGRLVTIQNLADAFGVSAMPVREALKRLTAANALTVVSGRTIGVPPITLHRLTDLRNVRLEIEGAATAWAAVRIDAGRLTSLEDDLVRMDEAIASGNTTDYLRANRSFHFKIYRASGSPVSVALIESLWMQISPYFNLLQGSGNYVSANTSHRMAVTALRKADADSAKAAIKDDIGRSYDVLASMLG